MSILSFWGVCSGESCRADFGFGAEGIFARGLVTGSMVQGCWLQRCRVDVSVLAGVVSKLCFRSLGLQTAIGNEHCVRNHFDCQAAEDACCQTRKPTLHVRADTQSISVSS